MPLPDASREEDTERDGFLSYAAEWHALTLGLYDGMKTWRLRPKGLPNVSDVKREPWYYKGGYVVGTLLQLVVIVVAATYAGVVPLP